MFRQNLVPMIAAVALATAVPALSAPDYPARPLRLIVPFSPGGGTDTLGRLISQKLSAALGQQVVMDNRPGAGANIGAEIAAKSAPDGDTLLMVTISHAINASLYSRLNYDLVRDFAPVTLLATTPHILAVHPSVPAKSVKELIALCKRSSAQLDYASSGSGSAAHLGAVLFGNMVGVRMNHVPYKGGGPAVIALIGGEVSVGFPTAPSVIRHVKSGKLRGLAVTTAKRSPSMPDLPTIDEAGVPGYEVGSWYGLLAPAGTPQEIVARLNAEIGRLLKLPEVGERLDAAGFEVLVSTPEQYAAFTRSEIEKWAKVVKTSGARVD